MKTTPHQFFRATRTSKDKLSELIDDLIFGQIVTLDMNLERGRKWRTHHKLRSLAEVPSHIQAHVTTAQFEVMGLFRSLRHRLSPEDYRAALNVARDTNHRLRAQRLARASTQAAELKEAA